MGPNGTHVTFYPTCPNEPDLKEAEAERLEQIERLEDMMYERADHEDNKYFLQHREIKRARCAPMKHKKPHMNRRIIVNILTIPQYLSEQQ